MVGGEEEQVLAFSDGLVEIGEEFGQVVVELHVDVVVLLAAGAEGVSDGIGRRDADAEHVTFAALSEFLVLDGCLCHEEGLGHAVGRHLDVFARVPGVFLVELLDPLWQILHVVGGGDVVADAVIPPVGGVGSLSGREDGGTVLHGYADDLRPEVGGHFEHVADGGCRHLAGRHLSGTALTAHALHGVVGAAVGEASVHVEVVAGDAVEGRCGSGVDAGVSDTCHGGHVVDEGVVAVEAFVDESAQTSLFVFVVVDIEVVPPHLVDDESYDQFRPFHLRHGCHGYHADDECQ